MEKIDIKRKNKIKFKVNLYKIQRAWKIFIK